MDKLAEKYGLRLRPCPYCGAEAAVTALRHLKWDGMPWYAEVQCVSCAAAVSCGTVRMSEELAVRLAADGWNRRVYDTLKGAIGT